MTPLRYVILVAFIIVRVFRSFLSSFLVPSPTRPPQISLHSILSISNESYGQRTSVSNLFNGKNGEKETETVAVGVEPFDPQLGKANAVFLMLCRNEEVDGAVKSIRELEDRFNHKYHYPWVFLNEEEFTEDFKKCVRAVASRSVGLIYQPSQACQHGNLLQAGVWSYPSRPLVSTGLDRRRQGFEGTEADGREQRHLWRCATLGLNRLLALMVIQGVSRIATCVGLTLGSSTATSSCRSTDITGVSSKLRSRRPIGWP
jgi:hypothetical protein